MTCFRATLLRDLHINAGCHATNGLSPPTQARDYVVGRRLLLGKKSRVMLARAGLDDGKGVRFLFDSDNAGPLATFSPTPAAAQAMCVLRPLISVPRQPNPTPPTPSPTPPKKEASNSNKKRPRPIELHWHFACHARLLAAPLTPDGLLLAAYSGHAL